MQVKLKLLYYSPIPWPHLNERLPSFPHTNEAYNSEQGVKLYRNALELFQYAETVGFDWLGVGEEHMNVYGVVPNPCLISAAIAAMTTKAKICVLGNPLPLLNPLRVAEEYAMIDVLSNGRLVAGFPRGVPQNYVAYGVNPDNSKEQLREAISFVLSAWKKKGAFNWEGTHYNFKNVSIWPQPKDTPELVFSAKSNESILLAVEHKGVLGELYVKNKSVVEHFQNSIDTYKKEAEQNGWEANQDRFLYNIPCFLAHTDEAATEKATKALSYVSNVISGSFESEKKYLEETYYKDVKHISSSSTETLSERISYGGIICGSPQTATEQIQNLLSKLPIGILGLQMQIGNLNYTEVRESLHLFGKYVKDKIYQ